MSKIKEKRGISALDVILIILIALTISGLANRFVLHGNIPVVDSGEEELTFKSIGPKTPVDGFSWTSGIKNNGTISFNIEIESEEAVKIGVYQIENSKMISVYEDWKYPSNNNVSLSVSVAEQGKVPETGKYALVVRNTENEKVLQRAREWKKGDVHFTIESASPNGKIKMKLYWSGNATDNPKKEFNLLIAGVEVYINEEKRKIAKSEFRVGTDDWREFSKNNMTALGHPWQYEQKDVRISLDSKVKEGSQPTKIVFKDAYGNKVAVYDQNIAYV